MLFSAVFVEKDWASLSASCSFCCFLEMAIWTIMSDSSAKLDECKMVGV